MDRYSLAPALIATVTLFTIAFLRRDVPSRRAPKASESKAPDVPNAIQQTLPTSEVTSRGIKGHDSALANGADRSPQQKSTDRLTMNGTGHAPLLTVSTENLPRDVQLPSDSTPRSEDRSSPVAVHIKAKDSMEFTKEMLEHHHPQSHHPPPTMIQLEKTKGLGLKASDSLELLQKSLEEHQQTSPVRTSKEEKRRSPLRLETTAHTRTPMAFHSLSNAESNIRSVSSGGSSNPRVSLRSTSPSLSSITPSMLGIDGDRGRIATALRSISILFNQAKVINTEERRILKSLVLDQDEEILAAFEEFDILGESKGAGEEEKNLALVALMNVLKRRIARSSSLV